MVAQGVFATGNLRSYCTVGEVLGVLAGYDFGGLNADEALEDRIRTLLPISRSIVDKISGRDFLWHADEVVTVDGSGSSRLYLTHAELSPPLMVREVRVGERVLGPEEWRAYPEMRMVRLTERARQHCFPRGVGNVRLVVDFGCEETPAEVKLAQAKLAAAELLAEVGGEGGAVQETRIGDYSVRYAEGGRFAAAVKALSESAAATLERYRTVRMGAV